MRAQLEERDNMVYLSSTLRWLNWPIFMHFYLNFSQIKQLNEQLARETKVFIELTYDYIIVLCAHVQINAPNSELINKIHADSEKGIFIRDYYQTHNNNINSMLCVQCPCKNFTGFLTEMKMVCQLSQDVAPMEQ